MLARDACWLSCCSAQPPKGPRPPSRGRNASGAPGAEPEARSTPTEETSLGHARRRRRETIQRHASASTRTLVPASDAGAHGLGPDVLPVCVRCAVVPDPHPRPPVREHRRRRADGLARRSVRRSRRGRTQGLGRLAAISRDERVRAFEELHLPLSATLSRATVIKVGELLGASELVIGTFRVQDRSLTVQAHTIRVDAGRVRQPVTETRPAHGAVRSSRSPGPQPDARAVVGAAGSDARRTAAARRLRELHQRPRRNQALGSRDVPGDGAPGFSGVRSGPTVALGGTHRSGRSTAALAAVRAIPSSSAAVSHGRASVAATSMLNLQRYDDAFETFGGLLQAPGAAAVPGLPTRGAVDNNLGVIQIRRGGTPQTGTRNLLPDQGHRSRIRAPPTTSSISATPTPSTGTFRGPSTGCARRVRRDPADADAHFVLAAALQATGSAVEAGRERDLARQLSSRYEELARTGSGRTQPVPRTRAGAARSGRLRRPPRRRHRRAPRRSAISASWRRSISSVAAGCSTGSRTARRWPSCGARSTCRRTKRRRTC